MADIFQGGPDTKRRLVTLAELFEAFDSRIVRRFNLYQVLRFSYDLLQNNSVFHMKDMDEKELEDLASLVLVGIMADAYERAAKQEEE